jgi:hypothetical protein
MSAFSRLPTQLPVVLIVALSAALSAGRASGDEMPRLMEVQSGSQTWTGRMLAHSDENTWLLDRYGQLIQLPASSITRVEVAGPVYRTASIDEFLRKLRQELPSTYKIATSRHFIIAAPTERFRTFSNMFEDVYSEVTRFYEARELSVDTPKLPLVAIVLESEEHFQEYCRRDHTRWSDDLRGYYSLKTNRVVLLDDTDSIPTAAPNRPAISTVPGNQNSARLVTGSLSTRTADTVVHEITHQIGFNTGIHSRFGKSPQWLIEGLALHLESNPVRTRSHGRPMKPSEQTNPERLRWYLDQYSRKTAAGDVAALIASDELFEQRTFDAYSLSWALTCYLSTGRSARDNARFFDYLQTVAARSPFEPYTVEERIGDFKAAFGDPDEVEIGLMRFLDEMVAPATK